MKIKIKQNLSQSDIYSNKGYSFYKFKKYKEALEYYNKAIELNPNKAKFYNNKGVALSALGRKSEALDCYNKAIELNPNQPDYYANKAWCIGKKLLGEAKPEWRSAKLKELECYNKLIELNPHVAMLYFKKALIYENLYSREAAKDIYKQGLAIGNISINIDNDKADSHIKNMIYKQTLTYQIDEETLRDEVAEKKYQDELEGAGLLVKAIGEAFNPCTIFNIDEVVYDKEILNHPELLKYLTENFGNLDRVLSINDLVCPELIAEAKANDDMELLLAGFNSAVDGLEYA